MTYGACLAIAWISFVKMTGMSPLAPGQWTGFLGVYAGLWAAQNFVRPIRFTIAMGGSVGQGGVTGRASAAWGIA